jgi:hypothetical protein
MDWTRKTKPVRLNIVFFQGFEAFPAISQAPDAPSETSVVINEASFASFEAPNAPSDISNTASEASFAPKEAWFVPFEASFMASEASFAINGVSFVASEVWFIANDTSFMAGKGTSGWFGTHGRSNAFLCISAVS